MAEKVQTIKEIHQILLQMFKPAYPVAEANALATLLIEEVTGLGRAHQLVSAGETVTETVREKMMAMAVRVAAGEPWQYVTGYTLFCGHRIKVTPAVLIPRPETEEMAAMIVDQNRGFDGTVIDLCTGSGCLAVTLASAMPAATVYGTDISSAAVALAADNAAANRVTVHLSQSDLLGDDHASYPDAGIIVSNPPYVRDSERKEMRANVLDHEPWIALFVPDNEPLRFYSAIADLATAKLSRGGLAYLEINEALGSETASLFDRAGFNSVTVIKDMFGRDRFIKAVL